MKKVIAGIGFLISGVLMYLSASLTAGINVQNTTEWTTSIGRYWQSVINCGLVPMIVFGIIFIITGALFMLWGVFSKTDN